MIRTSSLVAIGASALLAACATTQEPARSVVATATLLNPDGQVAGTATLGSMGSHLDLEIEVRGLSHGPHGLHLHTTGRCNPRDFASAGGHLNPYARQHGSLNSMGSHLGDLPNVDVLADGTAKLTAPLAGDRGEILPKLFDEDGTAIVVHAGPDDYRTDPSGSSGGRIACGVFTQVQ